MGFFSGGEDSKEVTIQMVVSTTPANREQLPFCLSRFQSIHGQVICGRMMLTPTHDPDEWQVTLPLIIRLADDSERWRGVLGEFLAGGGFLVRQEEES